VVVHVLNGPSPVSINSFAEPDLVGVQVHSVQSNDGQLELTFPPHSFSCVELHLR
jgi:hypothetical protein